MDGHTKGEHNRSQKHQPKGFHYGNYSSELFHGQIIDR
jgi:hypothetical protein